MKGFLTKNQLLPGLKKKDGVKIVKVDAVPDVQMLEPIEIDEIYVDGLEANKRAGKKTKGTQVEEQRLRSQQ